MVKSIFSDTLKIPGPAGNLEAIFDVPKEPSNELIAIFCHPHPQHQGTMLNKVVHTMARAMNDLGISVLRFNFRGVGNSDGSYDDGTGELNDVLAIADYVHSRWHPKAILLGGFSFGAGIAARAAIKIDAAQLITIAPPVNTLISSLDIQPDIPWLILHGAEDEIVSVDCVIKWVDNFEPGPELIVLPKVGHFFHGHLGELRKIIVHHFDKLLTRKK